MTDSSVAVERSSLAVHQWGTASRPCMLIHGFGEGAYVWVDFVRNLPPGYRAYAVDLRGHGSSPRSPDGLYPRQRHVSDVIETLDTLRLNRLVLIGHSLGGDIATRIALAQPNRVAALVIVDLGLELRDTAARRMNGNLWHSMHAVYSGPEEYLRELMRARPLASIDLLRHCAAEALQGSPETGFRSRLDWRIVSPANNPRNDSQLSWDMLAQIACPTLLLRGASSSVLPRIVAEKMAGAIPGCALREIRNAGHAPMLENPQEFRELVGQFMSTVQCVADAMPGASSA
jgi:pimeloyl-ACP methyl ester carboxylesterase